jgi:hypothetical protein
LGKIRESGRLETNLYNLQIYKQGNEFWSREGFLWCGVFDLSKNSDSHAMLNAAVEKRLAATN